MVNNKGKPIIASILVGLLALTPSIAFADSGVDVSNHQGCISQERAQTAKNSGASFVILKYTEGNGYVDRAAACTMQGVTNAGLRRAVYHFARPDLGNTADAEADWFISQTREYIATGVIPVLDWEPGGTWNKHTDWALRWLQRVEQAWGVKPLIYMSASTIKTGDWTAVAQANYGLWAAGYPAGYAGDRLRNPGAVPYDVSPWPFAAAWQYSSTGNVPGIGERVDVNWFYGDAGTWAKYAKAEPGTHTNPTPSKPAETPQQGAPTGDTDTLARAVIRGDYDNLPQRRLLLGSRYEEVQARVEQILANTPTVSQPADNRTVNVTIQAGDTISGIATRTGLWPLSAWHVPSGNINQIWPGQTATYNGGQSVSTGSNAPPSGHVVRAGESLWSIYGTGWQAAAQRNGIHAPYLIYPGQVLR